MLAKVHWVQLQLCSVCVCYPQRPVCIKPEFQDVKQADLSGVVSL